MKFPEGTSDGHDMGLEGHRPIIDAGGESFAAASGGDPALIYDASYITPAGQSPAETPDTGFARTLAASSEQPGERPITARVPDEAGEVVGTPVEGVDTTAESRQAAELVGPSLQPGEAYHYKDGEWREGADDSHYDPEEPDTAYAEAGTLVVGRAEPGKNVTFFGSSEGCRIVTIYNTENQEGALLHVDAADAFTDEGERMIDGTIGVVPALTGRAVVARIFGDVEQSDIPDDAEAWNDRLEQFLRDRGVTDVAVVTRGYGKQVRLTLADGHVEAFDASGNPIHDETPGEPTA